MEIELPKGREEGKESKGGRNGSWIVEVGLVVETTLVKLMSEAKQMADPNR